MTSAYLFVIGFDVEPALMFSRAQLKYSQAIKQNNYHPSKNSLCCLGTVHVHVCTDPMKISGFYYTGVFLLLLRF